jgi:hypothetical protein
LSDDIGSWKIIAIRFPRSRRISRIDRCAMSMSSKRMRVRSETVARLDKRRMTDRAVTELPDPLSPTSAVVLPRHRLQYTSPTA